MLTIKRQPLFGFSDWLNEGFWLLFNNKFLAVPITLMIALTLFLPVAGTTIIISNADNVLMKAVGGFFLSLGLILMPILLAGLWNFTKYTNDNEDSYKLSLLISGFQLAPAKLITLGLTFFASNIVFVLIGGGLSSIATIMAKNNGVDVESTDFLMTMALPNIIFFLLIYPFVLAQITYSPFLLTDNPEMSLKDAIILSIKAVTGKYFTFFLLIIYSTILLFIFLMIVGFVPGLVSGLLSMLPWENKMEITKQLMVFPQIAISLGILFCISWVFTVIFKSYSYLFEES